MNKSPHVRRYKDLDALRGLAAIMVVLFHLTISRSLPFHLNNLRLGNTGVDLFFMISGFVIFMSFEHISKSSQFIMSRVVRLYPTYWIAVTFTFLLIIYDTYSGHNSSKTPLTVYLANLTMFQYYFKVPDIDGPYWTMVIEMLFYIIMLILFRLKLLRFINIIGLGICLLAQVLFVFSRYPIAQVILFYIPFLKYCALFFSGTLFYQIISGSGKKMINYSLIFVLFLFQINAYHFIRNTWTMSHTEYACMLTLYYVLFLAFVNNRLHFITSKPTLFFGKISYALYLIHQYLSIYFIIPRLMAWHLRYLLAAIIAFAVSTILATLITYYIEAPIVKWGKKYIYSG